MTIRKASSRSKSSGETRAFSSEACPALDAGWVPVRVKKTRQNKKIEPRSDSNGTEKALGNQVGILVGPGIDDVEMNAAAARAAHGPVFASAVVAAAWDDAEHHEA